jgi:hypothetical protein
LKQRHDLAAVAAVQRRPPTPTPPIELFGGDGAAAQFGFVPPAPPRFVARLAPPCDMEQPRSAMLGLAAPAVKTQSKEDATKKGRPWPQGQFARCAGSSHGRHRNGPSRCEGRAGSGGPACLRSSFGKPHASAPAGRPRRPCSRLGAVPAPGTVLPAASRSWRHASHAGCRSVHGVSHVPSDMARRMSPMVALNRRAQSQARHHDQATDGHQSQVASIGHEQGLVQMLGEEARMEPARQRPCGPGRVDADVVAGREVRRGAWRAAAGNLEGPPTIPPKARKPPPST